MNYDYKLIAAYIQANLHDCSFVGISDDKELFVAFSTDDEAWIKEACGRVAGNYPDKVSKVTVVEKLDVKKATEMIEDLNKLLEEEGTSPSSSDLLTIGRF